MGRGRRRKGRRKWLPRRRRGRGGGTRPDGYKWGILQEHPSTLAYQTAPTLSCLPVFSSPSSPISLSLSHPFCAPIPSRSPFIFLKIFSAFYSFFLSCIFLSFSFPSHTDSFLVLFPLFILIVFHFLSPFVILSFSLIPPFPLPILPFPFPSNLLPYPEAPPPPHLT